MFTFWIHFSQFILPSTKFQIICILSALFWWQGCCWSCLPCRWLPFGSRSCCSRYCWSRRYWLWSTTWIRAWATGNLFTVLPSYFWIGGVAPRAIIITIRIPTIIMVFGEFGKNISSKILVRQNRNSFLPGLVRLLVHVDVLNPIVDKYSLIQSLISLHCMFRRCLRHMDRCTFQGRFSFQWKKISELKSLK